MSKHAECPACRSTEWNALKLYEQHFLCVCLHCDLHFSSEIPEIRDLEKHYDQYGRDDFHSPITIKRYQEWLLEFEKYRAMNNILDIGCGVGYFLEEAMKVGWNAYGAEISEKAVEICEAKGIVMMTHEKMEKWEDNKFDVITAIEVIEHLPNPAVEVKKWSNLLRPGGLLYLTTPNFDSLNRRLLKSKWDVLSYPEHLSYFNKKSLHHMLTDLGFKKITSKTDGISPGRIKSSLTGKPIDHANSGTTDEGLRKASENNRLLRGVKRLINWKLNLFSAGESLKALYMKNDK